MKNKNLDIFMKNLRNSDQPSFQFNQDWEIYLNERNETKKDINFQIYNNLIIFDWIYDILVARPGIWSL